MLSAPGGINWDDIDWEHTTHTGLAALLTIDGRVLKYAQSKAANIILAAEAAKQWAGTGVVSLVRPPPPNHPPSPGLTRHAELEPRQPEIKPRPHNAGAGALPARNVHILSGVLRRADGAVCGAGADDYGARARGTLYTPVGPLWRAEERYYGGVGEEWGEAVAVVLG